MDIDLDEYRVTPNSELSLSQYPTLSEFDSLGKKTLRSELKTRVTEFSFLQELLFAEKKQALLVVFQGMDAAGKDSTIKQVASGVNPQGLRVFSYDKPTTLDLSRSYLHRHWEHFPAQGFIVFFNRSHYEEVLVVRVHPDILKTRNIEPGNVTDEFWQGRFEDIRSMERHLVRNQTSVVKIFLHLSSECQKKRLKARIQKEEKHWKFDPSDLRERVFWDDYQAAYSEAISATSTEDVPWYVVPADHKPSLRLIVAEIIVESLRKMNPTLPTINAEKRQFISYYQDEGVIE